jgi:hypothetical protein
VLTVRKIADGALSIRAWRRIIGEADGTIIATIMIDHMVKAGTI